MREIKFRGKRIDNNEIVFGCLVNNMWTYSDLSQFEKGTKVCEIFTGEFSSDNWIDAIEEDNFIFSVYPDSVSQFTGLKDKNGTEIYEGDIIQFFLAPKELEHDSSENMFGTEPQNSWMECTKATQPILVYGELFYNDKNICFGLKNINCYVLEESHEHYHIADPNEIGGGADGYETEINENYENWCDFQIDSLLYDVWFEDFIQIEVIGNIHEK